MLTRAALVVVLIGLSMYGDPKGSPYVQDPLRFGPHAVGFRGVEEVDRSRMVHARTTFDGKPIAGDPAMPMRIGIWYPAQATSAAPMTREQYHRLGRGPARARDMIVADWKRMLGFAGLSPADADLQRALDQPQRAVRDGAPLAGRHPVIIGGMESPSNSATLGEYLASHGYVVVTAPSLQRTGTQQASAPLVAIETQARNIEYLLAFTHGLAFADSSRLGVIGINFDGMAALTFEMRNMRADAVVSLDGWEGKKNGAATMRESLHYDPVRLRAPYLVFEQDEPSIPSSLAHDRSLWEALKYSQRQWYVLRGFGHLFLTTDQLGAPGLPPAMADAYTFLYTTVREFLDTHVKKTPPVAGTRSTTVVKEEHSAPAISAAPTGEEFEELVMSGPIERAAGIFRRARTENRDWAVADEGTLNLYAFRFGQQKKAREVLVLRELAAEAFPTSVRAAYNLGVARTDAGDAAGARAAFNQALALMDADARMADAEKGRLRADIRQKIGG